MKKVHLRSRCPALHSDTSARLVPVLTHVLQLHQETIHILVKNSSDLPFPGPCQTSYRCLQINECSLAFCWSITSCKTPILKCLPQLNFSQSPKGNSTYLHEWTALITTTKQEGNKHYFLWKAGQGQLSCNSLFFPCVCSVPSLLSKA